MLIPSLGGGGAERIVLDLANGLAKNGHTVEVFVLEQTVSYEVPGEIKIRYLQRLDNDKPLFWKGLSLLVAFKRLYVILKNEGHDCVIGHMERCSSLVLFTPPGTKGILAIHNYLEQSLAAKSFAKKYFARALYKMAAALRRPIFFVSEVARNNALHFFGFAAENTVAIPNFAQIEEIRRESLQGSLHWEKTLTGKSIVTAGRLIEQKGHWHLIRAFSTVIKTVPDAMLFIFGEGPLRHRLQHLIRQYELEANIILPGFTNEVFYLLRNARVFALPSLYEGMPIVLLEALACEAAIITTDCKSGPREILAPGTSLDMVAEKPEMYSSGILVPPFDGIWRDAELPLTKAETHLSDALVRLLEDEPLNMALRDGAAQRAEHYTLASGVKRWEDALLKFVK